MACPGSVRLSEGIPNTSSPFAQEGTAAHALAELALRKGVDPDMWLGMKLEGIEVSEDMVDFVRVFTDYCMLLEKKCGRSWIEYRFNLAALNPPAPMFGTADFVAYDERTKTLHVVDLKYGQGVVVEAVGNKQLRYYALGATLAGTNLDINDVWMTIVQPRASHSDGAVRTEIISYVDLLGYAGDLLEAARATTLPDAPLVTGSHCRFCPAAGICPARMAEAQAVASIEFGDLPLDIPPAPGVLTDEVFADVLSKLHILEDWAKSVRAFAAAKLSRGDSVPGFKMVAKRATRKWASEETVAEYMKAASFEPDEYFIQKVKSPAQIEKLFPLKQIPEELVVNKVSSGATMVADSDPRPALALSAGDDFMLIGDGSDD